MNRRILVLKMILLAVEELIVKDRVPHPRDVLELTLQYGAGVNIEEDEVRPLLRMPLIEIFDSARLQ